jgi:hypothetical protein
MAEWLRRGLQILARRFDSGSGLHAVSSFISMSYDREDLCVKSRTYSQLQAKSGAQETVII